MADRFDMGLWAQRQLDPVALARCIRVSPRQKTAVVSARNLVFYNRKDLPSDLRYAASDHAVGTDKTRNDATCLLIVGVDKNDDIYLLDAWWEKRSADKLSMRC